MKRGYLMSDDKWLMIGAVILTLFTAGTPDLLDAIIAFINRH